MGGDVIIRAEGLGKKYVIGHQSAERPNTLRDMMALAVKSFTRTTRDILSGQELVAGDETEEFWALRNINFEIKRGDVVGIIGRNGAGKSTLLKVLSRITEPTEGRVTINGRVASLLEVGTGFHPELTGRENIYLNGAILGMGRAEITRKFDEIVDFAGVEKFLDTPVKRYSSGMYVRLAFAVAAHLEPEILIVDEVLAVGDAEFQKKCLGKMKDVSGQGRTVLFVSHNMGAIKALCGTGIVLTNGHARPQSPVNDALLEYSQLAQQSSFPHISLRTDRTGNGAAMITGVQLTASDGPYLVGSTIEISLDIIVKLPGMIRPWILFRNGLQEDILMIMPTESNSLDDCGRYQYTTRFQNALVPGRYSVACGIVHPGGVVDWVNDACEFEVESSFADGRSFDERLGATTLPNAWQLNRSHEG
jgi:ABC-type polysaccharide/polyol phosphate transport system ATPase subunit